MTDQRNPGRAPEPSPESSPEPFDGQQPYRPPQRGESERGESQRGESGRWSEDDTSDQRYRGQSTEGARPPARSPLGSPLGARPASPNPTRTPSAQPQGMPYQDDQAAAPYPQRRSQPPRSAVAGPQPYPPTPPTIPPSSPANRTGKAPSRMPFWLGFALSFLFLSLASLGILLLSTGADRFDLASLQGGEAAWVPPEIAPTPTQDPAFAGAVNASSSGGGQYGTGTTLRNVTNTNVRIRQTPGHLSKPDGDIIAGIPTGGQVAVIGGPATVDGLTWWQVRYINSSGQVVEGWSAEVTPSGVRILGPDQ